ncbi:MAG: O-antigen ligase family protein [Patescibacteria group bacterium]|nr:O-antigen ligase family protein [Patescibacteria group bacterium]
MPQIRGSTMNFVQVSLSKLRERRTWFELAWRFAFLVLPWQTRWFHEQGLAGWPWEQGRWSFYLAWLPMIAAIFLGRRFHERKVSRRKKRALMAVLVLLFVVNVFGVASGADDGAVRLKAIAATQWWFEAIILSGFFFTLWGVRVVGEKVLGWFVISLLPVVGLSYVQFLMQKVVGSKWLGIALHDPRELGVSVVEFGEFRLLRIYGSMPHPNIWGGWLAFGILAAAYSAFISAGKKAALFWAVSSALIAGVLVLTFSRAAYLSAAIGTGLMAGVFFARRKFDATAFQFGMLALCLAVLVAGVVSFSQREAILSRTQEQGRLEEKSLSQRGESLEQGFSVLKRHLLFGSGANAEQIDVAIVLAAGQGKKYTELRLREPIESPHNAFLLLLVDFGIVGSLLIAGLSVLLFYRKIELADLPFLACLVVVLWFDHYGISYWSGLSLMALGVFLCAGKKSA